MALYSDSTDDLDTIVCFFDFQETSKLPMKTQKPVVDSLVSGQLAQLAFEYAISSNLEFAEKNMPCPGVPFIYQMILRTAL